MKNKIKNNLIDIRSSIYNDLNKSIYLKNKDRLLFKFDMKKCKKEIEEIKKNVIKVIFKSLNVYYKKKFIYKKNFLNFYKEQIFSLPNITPNGALQPKKEIVNEINKFHLSFVKLIKKIGIYKNINKAMHAVIRIRVEKDNNKLSKRSYSASKLHTDAWSGFTLDAIAMIMLFGDIDKNYVEFYMPTNFKKNILKKLKDYNQGKKLFKKVKYLAKSEKDELIIFDQLCLHRTMQKKNSGPRISLDMGLDIKKIKKKYNFLKKSKRYKIFSRKKWTNLDYKIFKSSKESINENTKFKNLFTSNT